MEIKFDNVDKVIESMTEDQLSLALKSLAVAIKNREVVDKYDFMDSLKIGLSWPSK
jgi:hypothetical protein